MSFLQGVRLLLILGLHYFTIYVTKVYTRPVTINLVGSAP